MVDATDVSALTGEAAWIDFPNPGFYRQADGTLNPVAHRDAGVTFGMAIIVYVP